MIKGNKDYIQPFKIELTKYLTTKKETGDIFIFYIVYKDVVKKFNVDFKVKCLNYIVDTVLYHCITMALDNNCDLEDLIITEKGEIIFI